jgi:hypothetical protein
MDQAGVIGLVAVVSIAPVALVVVVAMVRGYHIHVSMTRPQHRRRRDEGR